MTYVTSDITMWLYIRQFVDFKCKFLFQILWESAIVNDYLDELYPEPKLNPDDPFEKARQRILLERWSKVGYSSG